MAAVACGCQSHLIFWWVLLEMIELFLFNFTFQLESTMLKRHGRNAYRLFKMLSKNGPLVEIHEICYTSSPRGIYQSLAFFPVPRKHFNYCRSVVTQTSDDEIKSTDESLTRIISAVESDPVSTEEKYFTYIESLCRSGSGASELLKNLRDKQIYLSPKAYNTLLLVAGERKNFELLTQIFKDLLLSNSLSPTSYSNLANAFSNTKDSGPVLKFVGEVSELIFPRSATIINRIISGFGDSRQMDKALMIFHHMKNLKCRPDVVTYNIVFDILGRAGLINDMMREFAFMKEANIVPDIISYNTLINSLRKMGRLDLCLVFYQEMVDRGLVPDLRTYTALIESFGRSGRVEEALKLLNEMKRKRIQPSIYVYRALVTSLKKVGKSDLAASLAEEMNSSISNLISPKDFKRKNK